MTEKEEISITEEGEELKFIETPLPQPEQPEQLEQLEQPDVSTSQYKSTGQFLAICKCEIHEKLTEEIELKIKEATTGYFDPQTGQESGTFVTYVIEFGDCQSRKRYSDFELLAAHLNRLYPHQVIPPIPEKETITAIISGYTGLKDRHDPFLIQHRTRLFQSFLNNLRKNPSLCGDHYFHRFIDSNLIGSTWSEGIATIPSKLGNEMLSGSNGDLKGKVPDPLVSRLEEMTQMYREGIKSIEKGQSKLLKRLKDESSVLSDLGASFNAFSLELGDTFLTNQNSPSQNSSNQESLENFDRTNQNEPSNQRSNSFRSQLEMIGQSSDSEVIHLHSLIRHHELLRDKLQEMLLYCNSIMRSLANLTYKRATLEDFYDQINGRKNVLMQMESSVRVDEEGNDLKKLRKNIEDLEYSKKSKISEMNDFSNLLLKDIDRTFAYFGTTWKESLRALAECQSHWHEEAINSWKSK